MKSRRLIQTARLAGAMGVSWLVAGCHGVPTRQERAARQDLAAVAQGFRPGQPEVSLPRLTSTSTLADYLRFAMLNQPSVAAAYDDWAASVEGITVARSRPDPTLTFQADITDLVKSVMPGLMEEFPGPGKLRAAGAAAAAGSQEKYFAFEQAVLQAAYDLKTAYYPLWFLDEKIRIDRQTLALLDDLERIARAQNEVGKGTLQDVYRARIERDRVTTEIANLEDSRNSLMAQLKAALGLQHNQPNPPPPSSFTPTSLELNGEQLLTVAFQRNPQLRARQAGLRRAQAELALARKASVPDFSVGLMADAVSAPTLYRPVLGMSLPIWRDKIAAEIAAAQADTHAAQARLSAQQIKLTVDFAIQSYAYREVNRTLALLRDQLIPESWKSLEIARAGYLGGQISFFNLIDAERTWLNFQLQQVEERTRRELVLADLSLAIAGVAPAGAPVLPGLAAAQRPARPAVPTRGEPGH
jgi:outer membrane protein, heavy metal efflux system